MQQGAGTGRDHTDRAGNPRRATNKFLSHVSTPENRNGELQKQVDSLQLQLLNHQALKENLSALQDSYTSLSDKHEQERLAHKSLTQRLQQQLDEAALARRKAEEQLRLTGDGSQSGVLSESKGVLEEIQAKYTDEVSNLTSEIRVKNKTLQDMRAKRITLVRYDACLQQHPHGARSIDCYREVYMACLYRFAMWLVYTVHYFRRRRWLCSKSKSKSKRKM